MPRRLLALIFLTLTTVCGHAGGERITDAQALEIGKRIWKNECAGTVSGLTSWNKGEAFPSLGIAHFIWYPEGQAGPFEESWPGCARFLKSTGVPVPAWMLGSCPWKTREAFLGDRQGPRLTALRALLAATVAAQARYAAMRLETALPKMLASTPATQRAMVERNFHRISAEPLGYYALIDYVNFKGEGVNPSECYQGAGWGLLQVLETMPATGNPLPAFSHAADAVLTRRVNNAPPARNEAQWLPGWRNRLRTYIP